MKRYRDDIEMLKDISRLLADIAIVNISSASLCEMIRKLRRLNDTSSDYTDYIECLLDSLLRILKENVIREIFVFTGQSQSGVSVVPNVNFPPDGYCFFGWVRLERRALPSVQDDSSMCIYKFASGREADIKLFLHNGLLYYSATTYKSKEKIITLQLTQTRLLDDIWYFFELYHFNSPPSVSFFIDGVEVFKEAYRTYKAPLTSYDVNSVGCDIVSKESASDNEVWLRDNFRGEMGVLHFAATNPSTFEITRSVLTKVHRVINMHDLFPLIAFGENKSLNMPRLLKKMSHWELVQSALLERIFLVVSPKYARNSTSEPEKIFTWKHEKAVCNLYNHTEEIYKQARIHHNYPGKDVLVNIGGIKCFMPILYELAEIKELTEELLVRRNVMVEKVLEIVKELSTLDRDKSAIFYDNDDGVTIVWYLLQRIARRGGLSSGIYDIVCQVANVLLRFYPNAAETFTELIYINMEIWKHSSEEVQLRIAEKMHQTYIVDTISKQQNILLVIDCLLKSVEVFTVNNCRSKLIISNFLKIVTSLSQRYINAEVITTIMSYANVHIARRLVNFPSHIYYVLSVFMELYERCKEKMPYILRDVVKVKRDSKSISTIFTIFDYFVFIRENGFCAAYKGLGTGSDSDDDSGDLAAAANTQQRSLLSIIGMQPPQEESKGEGEAVVDWVIAMSVYWMLSFDWTVLSELCKEFSKENKHVLKGNLVGYIIKSFGRIMVPSRSKMLLLSYIFNGKKQRKKRIFGPACYSAFRSLIFGLPFHPQEFESEAKPLLKELEGRPKLVAQPLVLQGVVEHLSLFTLEARREFFRDFAEICEANEFLTEVVENEKLVDGVFTLNNYSEANEVVVMFQQKVLCCLASQPALSGAFAKTCATLPCSSKHQLVLLNSVLDSCLNQQADSDPLLFNVILQVTYAVEDAVVKDPACCLNLQETLCKLLYLLSKTNILYVSLPVISLFDRRNEEDIGDWVSSDILRFVRILLKILFLCSKLDRTSNVLTLLRYYLLRDKSSWKAIKQTITTKNYKHKCQKYNVLDLVVAQKPEAVALHRSVSEKFAASVLENNIGLLHSVKVAKKVVGRGRSVFEEPGFVWLHAVTNLIELIYFQGLEDSEAPGAAEESEGRVDLENVDKALISLLEDVLKYVVNFSLEDTMKEMLEALAEKCEAHYKSYFPTNPELLVHCYNFINRIHLNKKDNAFVYSSDTEEKKCVLDIAVHELGFKNFRSCLKTWLGDLFMVIKSEPSKLFTNVIDNSYLKALHPYFILITENNFKVIDTLIRNKVYASSFDLMGNLYNYREELQKFCGELQESIYEKFGHISIPKKKMERDELTRELEDLAAEQYCKLLKEEAFEVGVSYNRKLDTQHKRLFTYVKEKYQKLLNKCALYQTIRSESRVIKNPFTELGKLSNIRDRINRYKHIRRLNKMSEDSIELAYNYLRHFYLKKLLLCKMLRGKGCINIYDTDFLRSDLQFSLIWNLFKVNYQSESRAHRTFSLTLEANMDMLANSPNESSISRNETEVSVYPPLQFDECIPKSKGAVSVEAKVLEAEMVTVRGAIFGHVSANSVCLSFKDCERKSGKKYLAGSAEQRRCVKKVNKKWRLDRIKQVVVKRFNLVRQAAEIYFNNSKSIFLSFFAEHYLKQFLKTLEESIKTKPHNIDIVRNPEEYFALKRFKERWVKSELSNFEYLMLLNKYGGRSFHDLSQYPVFPWVIADYESTSIDLASEKTYRPLNTPITRISPKKAKAKDVRVLATQSKEKKPEHDPYYLSYEAALNYLLRLEPYSGLLAHVDSEEVKPYHAISDVWKECNADVDANRELIPEFFYLPELFGNYNFYSLGFADSNGWPFRIDQEILPPWSRNNHHFVQLNVLALESYNVSFSLNAWIDIIFGVKHKEPPNPLATFNDNIESAPMRLFRDKHPQKNREEYRRRHCYALLAPLNSDLKGALALLRVHSFKAGITQIYSYDTRVIVVLCTQKLHRTHDEYLNVAHERTIVFDRRDRGTPLFPYKPMFISGSSHLSCDARRGVISLDQGNFLITCRHYDNSCKIINILTGDVLQHLYFHKTFVFAIASTKDKRSFYSGSLDGVVAKWNLGTYKTQPVSADWYVCDHKLAVITIDADQDLDLVASGSLDGTVALRVASTGQFVRVIKPVLFFNDNDYAINQIRLSYRGYVLVLARCKYPRLELSDYFLVYSVNGEEVARTSADDTINAMLLDETGFQLVAGGKCGKIYRVDLLSLESHDLLEYLDEHLGDIRKILHHFLSTSTAITALELTKQENCQQLLIGLSTGELYTLKYSPRVTSGKLFDNLQGLILSK